MTFSDELDNTIPIAEFAEPERKRGLPRFFLGCGCSAGLLFFLFAGGIIWYGAKLHSRHEAAMHNSFVAPLAPGSKRWDSVANSFGKANIEVPDSAKQHVEQLIKATFDAQAASRTDDIRRMIDKDGFVDQMCRSGYHERSFVTTAAIKATFDMVTDGPMWFENLDIISIEELGPKPTNELLVSAYCWDSEYDDVEPVRFWITKSNDRLKISDWEFIYNGMSEATEYAVIYRTDVDSKQLKNYYQFWENYVKASESAADYEYEQARRYLNRMSLDVMPPLKQKCLAWKASLLHQVSGAEETIEFLEQHRKKPTAPLVTLVLAECYDSTGDHAAALKAVDEHLSDVEYSPRALALKAKILHSTEQYDLALDQLEKIAKSYPTFPAMPRSLNSFVRSRSVDRVIAIAELTPKPNETLKQLIDRAYGVAKYPAAKRIASKISNLTQSQKLEIDAKLADVINDTPTVAQKYLEAAQSAETPDDRKRLTEEYTYNMDLLQRADQVINLAPAPKVAMDYLWEMWQNSDASTSDEMMLEIAEQYQAKFPKSQEASLYVGCLQSYLRQFAAAEKTLRPVVSKGNLSDVQQEEAESYLLDALVNQNKIADALALAPLSPTRWKTIAQKLKFDDFEQRRILLTAYEKAVSSDASLAAESDMELSILLVDWSNGRRVPAIEAMLKRTIENEIAYATESALSNLLPQLTPAETGQLRKQLQEWSQPRLAPDDKQLFCRIFSSLIRRKIQSGQEVHARELISTHAIFAGDEAAKVWAAEFAMAAGDTQAFVKAIRRIRPPHLKSAFGPSYLANTWISRVIEELRASNELRAADNFIQSIEGEFRIDNFQKLTVALDRKNVPKAIEILKNIDAEGSQYQLDEVYSDPSCGFYMTDGRFREHRSQHVPSGDLSIDSSDIVLAFDERPVGETIARAIENSVASLKFELVPSEKNSPNAPVYYQAIAFDGPASVSIAIRKGRLASYRSTKNGESSAWFVSIGFHNEIYNAAIKELYSPKLLNIVGADNLKYVYVDRHQLFIPNPLEWLNSEAGKAAQFVPGTDSTYHWFQNDNALTTPYWQTQSEVAKSLLPIIEAPETALRYEILATYTCGGAVESHWFPVNRVFEKENSTVLEFERTKRIVLFPNLPVGGKQFVSVRSVDAIRKK